MKIKKNDQVLIISGKDRGRIAKVIKSLPKEAAVLVEGINLKKKHVRPKREGEKGQIVSVPALIDSSNVKIVCPKCKKAARVGYKNVPSGETARTKKFRICKKCGSEI